jgi:hypothetical protein
MKTNYKTPSLTSVALTGFALAGIFMILLFLFTEISNPEYLAYFAPILGLLFYGSYYIINNKLYLGFHNGAYNEESNEV